MSRDATKRVPRRWAACFDDDNDHDPAVLEDCKDCGGRGTICVEQDGVAELGTCPMCNGAGTTGRVVRFFEGMPHASRPEAEVTTEPDAVILCPGCGERFAIADVKAWTGRRHRGCGQAIRAAT